MISENDFISKSAFLWQIRRLDVDLLPYRLDYSCSAIWQVGLMNVNPTSYFYWNQQVCSNILKPGGIMKGYLPVFTAVNSKICADDYDGCINMAQVGNYLGVSLSTVKRYVKQNTIPFTRINGRVVFQKKAIDHWLAVRSEHVLKLQDITKLYKEIEQLRKDLAILIDSKNMPNQDNREPDNTHKQKPSHSCNKFALEY